VAETTECNAAHIVVTYQRREHHSAAKYREIVGEDGRRTAQSELETGRKNLALKGYRLGETIKDQVEVRFAYYRDVKLLGNFVWHSSIAYLCNRYLSNYVTLAGSSMSKGNIV
jgi:hypothetical protein